MPVTITIDQRTFTPESPADERHGGWRAADLVALADYLEALAGTLELKHWNVNVDLDTVPEDCFAQIETIWAQTNAILQLTDGFLELDPEVQRATLVHELLHLHLNPVGELSDETLRDAMSKPLVAMHGRVLWHALEQRVDLLSQVIAPSLPLPSFGVAADVGTSTVTELRTGS